MARALERRGATVTPRAWNDPAARFDGFDAVVFRSNWDYHHAPDDFLAWLARWEAAGVRFWNPPDLIRWNLSKRYLARARAGGRLGGADRLSSTETSPTPCPRCWPRAAGRPRWSSRCCPRPRTTPCSWRRGDAGAVARTPSRRAACARPVMVQPFVEEIRSRGEWSLVFIDGDVHPRRAQAPGRRGVPRPAALRRQLRRRAPGRRADRRRPARAGRPARPAALCAGRRGGDRRAASWSWRSRCMSRASSSPSPRRRRSASPRRSCAASPHDSHTA